VELAAARRFSDDDIDLLFTLAARVGNNLHYLFGDELEKELVIEMLKLGLAYHCLNFGPIFGFLSQVNA
jgi:hypothetical protein